MKLRTIVNLANDVYPDGLVWSHFTEPEENHGDTLAQFIARELESVYDKGSSTVDQLRNAADAMQRAQSEISAVRWALLERLEKEIRRAEK